MGDSDGLFDGLVLENLSEDINMIYFNEMTELDLICMRLADMLMFWI